MNITRNKYVSDFLAHRILSCIAKNKQFLSDKEWAFKIIAFSPVENKSYSIEELEVKYQNELNLTNEMIDILESIYFNKDLPKKNISNELRDIFELWANSKNQDKNEEMKALYVFHNELLSLFPKV